MAGVSSGSDGDMGFQIAPMIDLILVLMVFFMSTVALKQVENELGITLPGSKPLSKTEAKNVDMNITIELDQSVSLNGDAMGAKEDEDLSNLREKLKEQIELFDDKIPVVITPNPDVPHKRVIEVLNACSAAKVKNLSFGG
jgi:biopolymer transport protein ExbD